MMVSSDSWETVLSPLQFRSGTMEHEKNCTRDCDTERQTFTISQEEFEQCLESQSECGMSSLSLGINILIGILTLIAIIAIIIRCCLFAKIFSEKGRRPEVDGGEAHVPLGPKN